MPFVCLNYYVIQAIRKFDLQKNLNILHQYNFRCILYLNLYHQCSIGLKHQLLFRSNNSIYVHSYFRWSNGKTHSTFQLHCNIHYIYHSNDRIQLQNLAILYSLHIFEYINHQYCIHLFHDYIYTLGRMLIHIQISILKINYMKLL